VRRGFAQRTRKTRLTPRGLHSGGIRRDDGGEEAEESEDAFYGGSQSVRETQAQGRIEFR